MSSISESKENILLSSGFQYHFDRMIYFNSTTKKIFSYEVVADNSEAWLKMKIKEKNTEQPWQFYFNHPSPDAHRQEIINEIEKI